MTDTNQLHNVRCFRKGEFLFRENESSRDVYIVNSGRVRVFKMEGGIEIELDSIGAGGVIGEIAAVDGGVRSASVLAVEDTNAFVITQEEFSGITGNIPEWLRKISTILAHRLREADARINCNLETDKTPHVAAAISLVTYSGLCTVRDSGFEISLKTLENEVVDILNARYSDIVSSFANLEKQGLLAIDKGKAHIVDRSKLDEFARLVYKTPTGVPQT
jgi:CRP/FNR family transcriptional regulator